MPKDGHGSASPFVEVEYDGQRQRTQTESWNETLLFNVADPSQLHEQTIEVTVRNDRRSSVAAGISGNNPNFLGRVRISGLSVASSADDSPVLSFPLEKHGLFSHILGHIGLRVYILPVNYAEAAAAAAA